MAKAEAAVVAEYLRHVRVTPAQMLGLELGQEYIAATENSLTGAMQDKAPVTPKLNPAQPTSGLPGLPAPELMPVGSAPWMTGLATASTDGPLPGGNLPSAEAIAAKARRPSMPPDLEDLPTLDRKQICSALELVIKGVEKMTEDEARTVVDVRRGKNVGLAHLDAIEGKKVGLSRFGSAIAKTRGTGG